jgi:hypothetical protein
VLADTFLVVIFKSSSDQEYLYFDLRGILPDCEHNSHIALNRSLCNDTFATYRLLVSDKKLLVDSCYKLLEQDSMKNIKV